MNTETITNEMHEAFQAWHKEQYGFCPSSRSTEPGYENEYENPFTNGAWKTWLEFRKLMMTEESKKIIEWQSKSLMRMFSLVGQGEATTDDSCAAEASLASILAQIDMEHIVDDYQDSHDAGPSLCELCGKMSLLSTSKVQAS